MRHMFWVILMAVILVACRTNAPAGNQDSERDRQIFTAERDIVTPTAELRRGEKFPDWIPELDVLKPTALLSGDYYAALADHYPDTTFAQYNTQADNVQIRFYTAAGNQHCILPRDEFYRHETAGVRLVDWVEGLVSGRAVENVQCDSCAVVTE